MLLISYHKKILTPLTCPQESHSWIGWKSHDLEMSNWNWLPKISVIKKANKFSQWMLEFSIFKYIWNWNGNVNSRANWENGLLYWAPHDTAILFWNVPKPIQRFNNLFKDIFFTQHACIGNYWQIAENNPEKTIHGTLL